MGQRRWLLAWLTLSLGACSAILGIENRRVGDDAPGSEAETGGEPDGGPTSPPDGATDGATDGSSFCATTTATFCRDFDTVPDPFSGFTSQHVTGGTTATLERTGAPPSPPFALRITEPATVAGQPTDAFGRLLLEQTTWTSLRVAFRLYFSAAAWTPDHRNVGVTAIVIPTPSGTNRVMNIVVSEKSLHLTASMPAFESGLASEPLPFDRWVSLVLELGAFGSPVQARLSLDGKVVVDRAYTITGGEPANVQLRFGLDNFNPPEPAFDVRYDNLVFDLR